MEPKLQSAETAQQRGPRKSESDIVGGVKRLVHSGIWWIRNGFWGADQVETAKLLGTRKVQMEAGSPVGGERWR